MEPNSEALDVLVDLTRVFATDNKRRDVEWIEEDNLPENDPRLLKELGFAYDENTVYVNSRVAEVLDIDLTEKEEFTTLMDTTSHEIEHTLVSNLNLKEDFAEDYDGRQKLAGHVINIVEDAYIDRRRLERKPGLKSMHTFFTTKVMESHDPLHEYEHKVQRFVNAMIQISKGGYAKGLDNCDDELQEFAGRVRPMLDKARRQRSNDKRAEVAEEIMDLLEEYLGDQDAMEQPMVGIRGGASGGEGEEQDGQQAGQQDGEQEQDGDQSGQSGSQDEDGDEDGENAGAGDEDGDDDFSAPDPEDIEGEIEDMMDAEQEGDVSDWHDANPKQNPSEPSEWAEEEYENYRDEKEGDDSELDMRRNERNKRMERPEAHVGRDRVLKEYDRRFADEVVEAFRQIKTRDRPTPTEDPGQSINMRGYIRFRAGDKSERKHYKEQKPAEVGDRCITIIVDGSGSMDELEAKLALKGLADAVSQIGDRMAAIEFHSGSRSNSRLITAPDESWEDRHLDSFATGGQTPTADGIKDGREVSDMMPNTEDVLIVITDGKANRSLSSRESTGNAMKDASRQVKKAKNEGKRVIGLGVGGVSESDMKTIFSSDYIMTDMNNLANTLLEIYRSQMDTTDEGLAYR